MPEVSRQPAPKSRRCFRTESAHKLKRLAPGATWDDVERAVGKDMEGRKRVIILLPNERPLRSSMPLELVIVAKTNAQRDSWIRAIRHRVAPLLLIEKRKPQIQKITTHKRFTRPNQRED